jgi:hypothetical protein
MARVVGPFCRTDAITETFADCRIAGATDRQNGGVPTRDHEAWMQAMLGFLSIAPWHVGRSVPASGRESVCSGTRMPAPAGRPPKAVGTMATRLKCSDQALSPNVRTASSSLSA